MSQIKGKDTRPEMIVRRFLHAHGFRYRLHDKKLPGKPDIVLKKYKTIIDVRGCFWHSHPNCKYGDNVITSSKKITSRRLSAIERDKKKMILWKQYNWNVIVVWAECQLEPRKKKSHKRIVKLNNIIKELKN